MKKLTCFMLAWVLLAALPAYSQTENSKAGKFSIGIVGGLNSANMYFPNSQGPEDQRTTSLPGFAAGIVLDIRLGKNLSTRIEPMYLQKGCTIEEGNDPANQPAGEIKVSVIEFPVLIQYTFGNRVKPYLTGGISFAYNLAADMEFELTGLKFTGDLKSITETFDFGLTFGGGLQYPIGKAILFLEGRYTHGLINQRKSGTITVSSNGFQFDMESDRNDDRYTNRGFQLLAGISFPIG